jgi:repressor LexA
MSNIGNKETMAKNLAYYVRISGKTQKEIAEVVGVAYTTFNDWVKGKKYPRIDKIEMLANYFGILKSDLIEEKSEEHKKMQEENNILADIVVRLRMDSDFLSVVEILNGLDSAKLEGVKRMLCAFAD